MIVFLSRCVDKMLMNETDIISQGVSFVQSSKFTFWFFNNQLTKHDKQSSTGKLLSLVVDQKKIKYICNLFHVSKISLVTLTKTHRKLIITKSLVRASRNIDSHIVVLVDFLLQICRKHLITFNNIFKGLIFDHFLSFLHRQLFS